MTLGWAEPHPSRFGAAWWDEEGWSSSILFVQVRGRWFCQPGGLRGLGAYVPSAWPAVGGQEVSRGLLMLWGAWEALSDPLLPAPTHLLVVPATAVILCRPLLSGTWSLKDNWLGVEARKAREPQVCLSLTPLLWILTPPNPAVWSFLPLWQPKELGRPFCPALGTAQSRMPHLQGWHYHLRMFLLWWQKVASSNWKTQIYFGLRQLANHLGTCLSIHFLGCWMQLQRA